MRALIILLSATLLLTSCEKVIDVQLKNEEPLLVVDGFINNDTTTQVISLQYSQPYFDKGAPTPALGALVQVISSQGDTFKFVDNNSSGLYKWNANPGDSICKIGVTYRLVIDYSGSKYEASSSVGNIPSVDSIKFSPNVDFQGKQDGFLAEFFATDPANELNFYRIKTYKNNVLFNNASDLNLSVNGAQFYPGYDGALFIQPVRFSVNNTANGAYQIGDSITVELYSITIDTWYYFSEVRSQINNTGLFATPTANVRTNIIKTSGNGANTQGWFCASAVTKRTEKVK